MAKLSALLVVLPLALVILVCVEGNSPRGGKKKSRNIHSDEAREEFRRISRRNQIDKRFELFNRSDVHFLPDDVSVAILKERLEHYLWLGGPNVCKNETMETLNFNPADTDNIDLLKLINGGTKLCFEDRTSFTCTLLDPGTKETTSYTIVYECCYGYSRQDEDFGCPIKITESNLILRLEELGLTDFLKAVKMLQLTDKLQSANFTLFVPQNGAFRLDSDLINAGAGLILKNESAVIEVSEPAVGNALQSFKDVILSHVVPGIQMITSFDDEDLVQTASLHGETIRINHFRDILYYARHLYHKRTANCVPITTSDVATNGIIHRIDKVLKPVTQSLLDIIRSRPELSTLKTNYRRSFYVEDYCVLNSSVATHSCLKANGEERVLRYICSYIRDKESVFVRILSIAKVLERANYESKLDEDGNLTILAPTNLAFLKMSKYSRDSVYKGDQQCLEKFLENHMIPNVICDQVIKGNVKTKNNRQISINMTRTKNNKIFFNDAQVVQSDVMGTNGVMHSIDKTLVPNEALGFGDILKIEELTEFLKLIKRAGLHNYFETMKDVTVFAPTNEAFQALPADVKMKLRKNPDFLKSLLNFHVSPTLHSSSDSATLTTLANKDVRIHTFRDSVKVIKTVECVPVTKMNLEYCSGLMNVLNSVMIPPEGNVMDVLGQNQQFSQFFSLIKKTHLADLLQGEGPFTVFAPNNEALLLFDERSPRDFDMNTQKLENFIKQHIKQGTVCCAQTVNKTTILNMAGDALTLSHSPNGIYKVHQAVVKTCDQIATNGIVWELHRVPQEEPRVP